MFDTLSDRLTAVLQQIRDRGVLTEDAIKESLREIRRVLLEADVSYELTRTFVERVREKAVGLDKIKSVSPGQQLCISMRSTCRSCGASPQTSSSWFSRPPNDRC